MKDGSINKLVFIKSSKLNYDKIMLFDKVSSEKVCTYNPNNQK